MSQLAYSSVLLKLSGEALAGDKGQGLDFPVLEELADAIKEVHALGVRLSLVVGGGNIIRGTTASKGGLDRVSADYMGMLGTVINAHLCAALPNLEILEIDIDDVPWKMDLLTEPFRIEDGMLSYRTDPAGGRPSTRT